MAALNRALFVVLLFPSTALARDVSFGEARAAAERAAPDVQLVERRAEISKAEIEVAGALDNPTVAVSTARQTARFGISVSVPVPLFGQRSISAKAARADADAAVADISVVRREARWGATLAWLDLWEAQERTKLLDLAATDARRLFQIASDKFDAGTGPRLDVVRSKADSARSAAEADDVRRLTAAAAARLSPWIGVPSDVELRAAGASGYSPDLLLAIDQLDQQLAEHPALRRDRAQVTAADLHVQEEQRLRWPMVSPQIAVNLSDPTLPGTDIILGLALDVPLLNLRAGPIDRARAQRALAEQTVSADFAKLRADLRDSFRRAEGAAAKLRVLRDDVVPSSQEARDMTEDGYRSGRVDLIRLLEAQRAYLESRLAEAEATANWGRAVADLERASGNDFSESRNAR
jgi:cobalt-zinc-cadmium efflux system outer membrane protein